MRNKKIIIFIASIIIITIAALFIRAAISTQGRTQLEFEIYQDEELILFSFYAEPPQFAS